MCGRVSILKLDRARDILKEQREALEVGDFPDFKPDRKAKAQVVQFPVYVRLLDAEAAGAAVADMAATIYPAETNTRADAFRVSTKIRGNLKAAKGFRDGDYWDMLT